MLRRQRDELVKAGILAPVGRAGFDNWKRSARGWSRYRQPTDGRKGQGRVR